MKATYTPIAFELLAQNACEHDFIYVKYNADVANGRKSRGGIYVRIDHTRRYFRFRAFRRDDPTNSPEFSVLITSDICFKVKKEDAEILKARNQPFDSTGNMHIVRKMRGDRVHLAPDSPFTRAGYDWDLSELEPLPKPHVDADTQQSIDGGNFSRRLSLLRC